MAEKITSELRMHDEADYPSMRGMAEWGGMPEYVSKYLKPHKTLDVEFNDGPLEEVKQEKTSEENMFGEAPVVTRKTNTSIHVHFESDADFFDFQKVVGREISKSISSWRAYDYGIDRAVFAKLIGQTVTDSTTYIWHPDVPNMSTAKLRYSSTTPQNPQYPVYIISKGRHETRLTAKAFERMGVPYFIVVEPQEVDAYESVIDFTKVLPLPCDNYSKSMGHLGWSGSIPARNFVWQHAVESGAKRHWIIDDNIRGFYRLNRNKKIEVTDGTIFRAAEDFVDRYENIAIAGFNYYMFAKHRDELPPFLPNRRIYSCILIKNDIDLRMPASPGIPECVDSRWRGRYNEDTDLSIRAMKLGYCTVLFYSYLCYKEATMTMKGGNMDELYQGDGRLRMAESLRAQHPDICSIFHKFGIQRTEEGVTQRAQHLVNYEGFKKNTRILKPEFTELSRSQIVDNRGMELREITDGCSVSE